MAFITTVTRIVRNVVGDRKITYGTYISNSSSTGGNIDTNLKICEHIQLQPTGSSVSASAPSVNETLPLDGSAITIVTVSNEVGNWIAYGR